MLKTRLLHETDALRTYVVFDKDEEAVRGLTDFATEEEVSAASLTGVGIAIGESAQDHLHLVGGPVIDQLQPRAWSQGDAVHAETGHTFAHPVGVADFDVVA